MKTTVVDTGIMGLGIVNASAVVRFAVTIHVQ
jgi:hypothetical protein